MGAHRNRVGRSLRSGNGVQLVNVAVLSGGVGAARFLTGLRLAIESRAISAIVNTGDDTKLHGLSISPDLDTITYTLANAIDPERGWGLEGETWNAMDALGRFKRIRPADSKAAPRWFGLGDKDLATHFYRTARLDEGATLTEATAEIASAWSVDISILPMTDHRFRTMIELADTGEEIPFQDYFVRLQHAVSIGGIRFEHSGAELTDQSRHAIETSDVVVVAQGVGSLDGDQSGGIDRADTGAARCEPNTVGTT